LPATASATYTDISLELTGPDQARNGALFDYAVTIRNRGSNYSATGVVFTHELPAEVEYVSSTLPGCTLAGDELSCAIGTVEKSSSATGTVTVRAIQPGIAHNAASIRGDQERSRDFGNNAAELDTPIAAVADLSIEQTASRDPVPAGESFDYTFTVSNAGPDTAEDVAITYDLPEGIDFVSSPDCTESARTVTCAIGEIPPGTSVIRTVTVLAARAGDAGSTATVGGAVDDPAPENNEVTTATLVAAEPVGSSAPPAGPGASSDPIPITQVQAVASPSTGDVLIRTPAETGFRPLTQTEGIPMGSELDTTRGRVAITTTKNRGGTRTQTAKFSKGRFRLEQTGGKKPVTDAVMTGALDSCDGTTASKKAKKGRSLFGNGHGRFRTSGSTGSASIRGTVWLVEDLCDGATRFSVISSRTKPPKAALDVDDFTKPGRRNAALAVGESYVAG
jgi:uncharacterized repeat protein (TIGR01451 family)